MTNRFLATAEYQAKLETAGTTPELLSIHHPVTKARHCRHYLCRKGAGVKREIVKNAF